jgi:hypothetical protein
MENAKYFQYQKFLLRGSIGSGTGSDRWSRAGGSAG